MNNYTDLKLLPADRDLMKTWFVAFRFTDPKTGQQKQFQFRGNLNRIKKKTERIEKVCRHIAAFFVFLPPGSKNIFPPFEKGSEQGYFCLKIFHLFVETTIR